MEAQHLFERTMAAIPDEADADHVSARNQLARIKLRQGFPEEAAAFLEIALRQIGELSEVAPALRIHLTLTSGVQQIYAGNLKRAREYFLEALDLAKEHELPPYQGSASVNLGELCRMQGDLPAAADYYEEAIRLSSGDPFSDSLVLFNLGSVAIQLNDAERAEDYFRQAIAVIQPATGIETANGPLGGLGYVYVRRGRYREAGLLMGYPQARRERSGGRMDPIDEAIFEEYKALGLSLGGEEYKQAFAEGAHLTPDELATLVAHSSTSPLPSLEGGARDG